MLPQQDRKIKIIVRFILTNMKKEERVFELFLNSPTKHWHFQDICDSASISKPQASSWLTKFIKLGLVKKIKQNGKMPYYVSDYSNPYYQAKKKIYSLEMLEQQGFLGHLAGLQKAKAVVIFGSFSRWDWHKDSDIDLFIYGNPEGLEKDRFRAKLHREIQVFVCRTKEDLKNFSQGLLKNIAEGYRVKGALDFIEVANA